MKIRDRSHAACDHMMYRPMSARRRLAAIAAAQALAAIAPAAFAAGDMAGDAPHGAFCSTTASLLFDACGNQVKSDDAVANAKCLNIGDAQQRRDCRLQMRTARAEATQLCKDQHDGRLSTCAQLGEARYDPNFDPVSFDSDFARLSHPNPYFPLGIGYKWEFRGGNEVNKIEIPGDVKVIEGVHCIVVHDLVYKGGLLAEATDDWYAAARDGNTWYCGEEVKDYESFVNDLPVVPELVSISGRFKHGVNHDKAGVIMQAMPVTGQIYLEEFSLANAEDASQVLSTSYSYGQSSGLDQLVPRELAQLLCHDDCVVTNNYSLLEPGVYAIKYYARNIGFFLETKPLEGTAVQLTKCNFDPRCTSLPPARP